MDQQDNFDIQEKQAIRFLKQLGFQDVNGGHDFKIGGRQIDAVGGNETTLLIFECTTKKDDLTGKLDEFRGNSNQKISALKHDVTYKKYNKFKLIFLLEDQEITETLIKRAKASKPEIFVWDNKFLSYYRTLFTSIKKYARYSLLAELGVKPDSSEQLELPAFQIKSAGKSNSQLFLFSVPAFDLVRFSYVARRQSGGENYYQRMVKQNRLTEIAKYIDKGMIFPNSIVVALNSQSFSFKKIDVPSVFPSWQSFGTLTLKDKFDTCWIIDGQHRLFAHTRSTTPGRIIVTAFANITEEKQAEYFLDINKEAKKVDANLLWDLLGSTNPGSTEGIISNSVKSMRNIRDGFFEDNINIPSMGDGKFSFTNICTAIKDEQLVIEQMPGKDKIIKNPIWNQQACEIVSQLSKLLNKFFSTLENQLSSGSQTRFYSDGFIAVMISLFKLLVIHLGKRPSEDDFTRFLNPLTRYLNSLSNEDKSSIPKKLTSKSGRINQRNEFIIIIQKDYDKEFGTGIVQEESSLVNLIGKLEYELNSLTNRYMLNKIGEEWYFDPNVIKSGEEIKRIKEQSRRVGTQPWEHLNFLSTLTQIVVKEGYWNDFFGIHFKRAGIKTPEDLTFYGRKLWDYRSNGAHERSARIIYTPDEELLIKAVYKMYKIAIASGNDAINSDSPTDEETNEESV